MSLWTTIRDDIETVVGDAAPIVLSAVGGIDGGYCPDDHLRRPTPGFVHRNGHERYARRRNDLV
jgi:hypothetical protein